MSISQLSDDLNIISALDDKPNTTGGLTASQLKAKFDEAGGKIKTYINGTIVPAINTEESGRATRLLSLVYPVGSIYMSVNNVSPATFLGGTWEQLTETFLMAAGSTHAAGTTGGSLSKTLTEANLPSHKHTIADHTHSVPAHTHPIGSHTHGVTGITVESAGAHTHGYSNNLEFLRYTSSGTYNSAVCPYNYGSAAGATASAGAHTHTLSGATDASAAGNTGSSDALTTGSASLETGNVGSGTAIDITPTYLSVYMWKRTA